MRHSALLLAVAAVAGLSGVASASTGTTAGQAAKTCRADAEVTPKGKIAFGLRCRKANIGVVNISAGPSVRRIKPTLLVDPRGAASEPPECFVLPAGDARCSGGVRADAIVTGWFTVSGDACDSMPKFEITGGGPCGPGGGPCKKALIKATIRTGVPAGC